MSSLYWNIDLTYLLLNMGWQDGASTLTISKYFLIGRLDFCKYQPKIDTIKQASSIFTFFFSALLHFSFNLSFSSLLCFVYFIALYCFQTNYLLQNSIEYNV